MAPNDAQYFIILNEHWPKWGLSAGDRVYLRKALGKLQMWNPLQNIWFVRDEPTIERMAWHAEKMKI